MNHTELQSFVRMGSWIGAIATDILRHCERAGDKPMGMAKQARIRILFGRTTPTGGELSLIARGAAYGRFEDVTLKPGRVFPRRGIRTLSPSIAAFIPDL